VWNRCFKGKPGTDKLIEAAAKGSEPEFQQIQGYLLKEMENPEFVEMVKPYAQEIHQTIVQMEDNSMMLQVNRDNAKGYQIKAELGSKVYFVERMENPD
jgi:DNA-binding FadR family transcriptional regulator